LSAFALKIAVKTAVFLFWRNGTQKLNKLHAGCNYIFQFIWFNPALNKIGGGGRMKKTPARHRSGFGRQPSTDLIPGLGKLQPDPADRQNQNL
jgi:hypothetical protein